MHEAQHDVWHQTNIVGLLILHLVVGGAAARFRASKLRCCTVCNVLTDQPVEDPRRYNYYSRLKDAMPADCVEVEMEKKVRRAKLMKLVRT